MHVKVTVKVKVKVKAVISSSCKSISELRGVACHMGSHSITCHPTQANTPHWRTITNTWLSHHLRRLQGQVPKCSVQGHVVTTSMSHNEEEHWRRALSRRCRHLVTANGVNATQVPYRIGIHPTQHDPRLALHPAGNGRSDVGQGGLGIRNRRVSARRDG